MTLVVGIAGAMRSGKSTLATMLATTYDLPIVSFAESLRVEVSQAFFQRQRSGRCPFPLVYVGGSG